MVSKFFAKFRTFILALIAVCVVIGGGVADFILRHEMKGKARRELAASGIDLNAGGIIQAIRSGKLALFEKFDIAGMPFGGIGPQGLTPLNFAIQENNTEAIDQLLARENHIKKTIDQPSQKDFTALEQALENQDFKLADRLIKLGANINREKTPGLPWLIASMQSDQVELRDYLLDNKIDVNAVGDQPHSALALAARSDDLALMKRLAKQGADLSINGCDGKTLLLESILQKEPEEIDLLLAQGVDTNVKGDYTHFPLAVAADQNDLVLMGKLVEHKAKLDIEGVSGKPLFSESVLASQYSEIDFLLEHGISPDSQVGEQDALSLSLTRNDNEMRSLLVKHGAKLDRKGPSGKHLLFEALANKDHTWFKQLIDEGLPVNKNSEQGETLILTALKDYDYETIDYLISKKVDLNQPNKKGITPAIHAASKGDTAIMRTLIENGAKMPWDKLAGIAYDNRDNPTMNLLLNAGMPADLKYKNTNKRLFDLAVADQSIDTARSLMGAGADIGNNFWIALQNGMTELVEMLVNEGQDVTEPGPDGRSPLEFAMDREMFSLVHPLLKGGAKNDSPLSSTGESWLSRTIRNGDSDLALALLRADINLGNERAADGHSLLGWAIANRMDDVALELIDRGVDCNIIEGAPASKEMIAKYSDSSKFQYYLKVDTKIRPIMMVAVRGNHKVAQAMMKAGARSYPSSKRAYPVAIAAWEDDVRMMQIIFGRDPDSQPRKLEVNLSSQRVKLYQNGRVVHSSSISSGKPGYRTPTGWFVITQKNRHHVSNLYDAEMPYFMRLSCKDFGFHTGNIPGYPASHGCIRLPNSTASKLYSICKLGDIVHIY